MANALKVHAVVRGKKLTLANLDAFEGKHVEVTVREDETQGAFSLPEKVGFFGCYGHLGWTVPDDFDVPDEEIAELFEK